MNVAASLITYAGDEQAIRETSKLIRLDNQRFGDSISRTLLTALDRGNPFTLAYRGLTLGDPLVDSKIMAWAEGLLLNTKESTREDFNRQWAKAMVERYNGEPTSIQMANDPISIRLKPVDYAALESDLRRFTVEAAQKRAKNKRPPVAQ